MNNFTYKRANQEDAQTIKNLINQMYGVEYEVRDNKKIAKAIDIS